MSITYELPMYSRLEPRTTWTGSRITDTDPLTLDEAAKFATKHAGTEITVNDFLRAAARGEITLRAIVNRQAKLQKFDGGIYCNKGTPTENIMPKGAIATLPVSACRQLANAARASWRTIDGYEMIDGQLMRYEIARLTDDEPDIETALNDCRVLGYDVHALADEYIDAPKEASKPQAASASDADKTIDANDWRVKARQIADELFDRDTANDCRNSLVVKAKSGEIVGGYAYKVMEEMQKRQIHGPRGRITNPGTILREALSGDKWWANKQK